MIAEAAAALIGLFGFGVGGWWFTGLVIDNPEHWTATIEQAQRQLTRAVVGNGYDGEPDISIRADHGSVAAWQIGNVNIGSTTPAVHAPVGTYPPRGKSRCDYCGKKCRKSIYTSGWNNPLSYEYAVCKDCIRYQENPDDISWWLGMDIVRG